MKSLGRSALDVQDIAGVKRTVCQERVCLPKRGDRRLVRPGDRIKRLAGLDAMCNLVWSFGLAGGNVLDSLVFILRGFRADWRHASRLAARVDAQASAARDM